MSPIIFDLSSRESTKPSIVFFCSRKIIKSVFETYVIMIDKNVRFYYYFKQSSSSVTMGNFILQTSQRNQQLVNLVVMFLQQLILADTVFFKFGTQRKSNFGPIMHQHFESVFFCLKMDSINSISLLKMTGFKLSSGSSQNLLMAKCFS